MLQIILGSSQSQFPDKRKIIQDTSHACMIQTSLRCVLHSNCNLAWLLCIVFVSFHFSSSLFAFHFILFLLIYTTFSSPLFPSLHCFSLSFSFISFLIYFFLLSSSFAFFVISSFVLTFILLCINISTSPLLLYTFSLLFLPFSLFPFPAQANRSYLYRFCGKIELIFFYLWQVAPRSFRHIHQEAKSRKNYINRKKN